MIPVEIEIKGKKELFEIPQTWEEVEEKHHDLILKLALKPMGERKKMDAVLKGFGMSRKARKTLLDFEKREIMKSLVWLNDPWRNKVNMVPRIGVFKGYKNQFSNLKLNQLIMAGIYIENADKELSDGNIEEVKKDLRKLCSILFTPFGIPYRYSLSKLYRRFFIFTPMWKLQAVAVSFRAMRLWLKDLYPLTHRPSTEKKRDFGPYGLIVDLAGDKFGTTRQVNYSEIHEIFTYLEKAAELAEKNK